MTDPDDPIALIGQDARDRWSAERKRAWMAIFYVLSALALARGIAAWVPGLGLGIQPAQREGQP